MFPGTQVESPDDFVGLSGTEKGQSGSHCEFEDFDPYSQK
jgi:hypothetical protein